MRFDPNKTVMIVMLCLSYLLLSGCASSRLVDTWRDPAYRQGSIRKIMVIAVIKDDTKRRIWEDSFVKALRKSGLDAVPSYREFAKKVPDESILKKHVLTADYGGILILRKTGQRKESYLVPGETRITSHNSYSPNHFEHRPWGYYGHTYSTTVESTPAHMEEEQIVSYQASVWEVKGDGRKVWTGNSETVDPKSVHQISEELSELVLSDLKREKML